MIVLAHRGYSGVYPENTVLAFEKAIDYGADGVELDVHLTKDGKMVVCHDESLYRTYGKHINIKEATFDEIEKYNSMGQKMPTLDEVFQVLPLDSIINIELKTNVVSYPSLVEKVLELVSRNNPERVWLSSFNHSTLVHVRKIDENAKLGMLFGEEHAKNLKACMKLSLEIKAFSYNIPIVAANFEGFDDFLEFAREQRIKIVFWDVNTKMDMEFAKEHGAYAIITNEIERATMFFKEDQRA